MKKKSILDHLKKWQPTVIVLIAVGTAVSSAVLFISSYGHRISVLEAQQSINVNNILDNKTYIRESIADIKELIERKEADQDQEYFRYQDQTVSWIRRLNDKVDLMCKVKQ